VLQRYEVAASHKENLKNAFVSLQGTSKFEVQVKCECTSTHPLPERCA